MISELIKLADRLDKNGQQHLSNELDAFILALAQELQGQISVPDLMQLKPGITNSLKEAITFQLFLEPDPDGKGNRVKAVPKIRDKWTDGLNLGDVSLTPGLENYFISEPLGEAIEKVEEGKWKNMSEELAKQEQEGREIDEALSGAADAWEKEQQPPEASETLKREEDKPDYMWFQPDDFKPEVERRVAQTKERRSMHKTEADVRSLLVKMADKYDQAGQHDLAAEIDRALKSLSARPKAPLKKLDDDIKKNLIVFIHDADQNNSKSIKGLNELFRRLRYFNFADTSKELGLDKVVKDMEKTQECLDGAKKRFYEVMHGRKPSRQNLKELFEGLSEDAEEQGALDFFDEQLKKEAPEDESELESPEDEDEQELESPEDEPELEVPEDDSELEDQEDELDLDGEDDEEELDEEMEKELEEFLASLDEHEEVEDE